MKSYILYLLILLLYPIYIASSHHFCINTKMFKQELDSCIKNYVTCNCWSEFDFTDSANYGSKKKVTEMLFYRYIIQSQKLPYSVIVRENNKILSMSANYKEGFIYFWELYEKYYYDPDSPYRNDSLYTNVLSYIMGAPIFPENYVNKLIYQWQLIHKNKVGYKAEDFSFITLSGLKDNLYRIKNDYVIIFFNIPDCEECAQTKKKLESISTSIENVSIVAIYPNNDYSLWSNAEYPEKWINGYDRELIILEKELYDLRVFPTMYLLDKDKTVILKDPSLKELFSFFKLI